MLKLTFTQGTNRTACAKCQVQPWIRQPHHNAFIIKPQNRGARVLLNLCECNYTQKKKRKMRRERETGRGWDSSAGRPPPTHSASTCCGAWLRTHTCPSPALGLNTWVLSHCNIILVFTDRYGWNNDIPLTASQRTMRYHMVLTHRKRALLHNRKKNWPTTRA